MKESRCASMPSRILIVDNEQDILDILTRVLASAGYDVDTASNGRLALEEASRRTYDLIITNIRMPVMDGKAFYRELRSSHPALSERVIFCTGDIANPTTRRFLRGAGAPVIFKPFALRTVLNVVSWKLRAGHSPASFPRLPLVPPEVVTAPVY